MSARFDVNALKVASPCLARWEDMMGDERARFCQHCQKHVYNFSAMTTQEVEMLVVEKEGNLCGRMYRREDGTVLTADCPTGHAIAARKRYQWLSASIAGLLLMMGSLFGVERSLRNKHEESLVTQRAMQKWEQFKLWVGITQPTPIIAPPPIGPGMIMGEICVFPTKQSTNSPAKTTTQTANGTGTVQGKP